MLKQLLRNAESGGESGGESTGGSPGSATNPQPVPGPAKPADPITGTPNDLAATTNGIVHQLMRFDSPSQMKILGAVLALTGIKLPE